ncbi:MAG: hypothetical protein SF028_09650 [Candidatus Sumerlaeia bacterium]|nr:hypothetical protein [Candidatus Sumerlaeia bacterium]
MPRYHVYRSIAGIRLGEDDSEPQFVFLKEDDIKTGLVVPGSNPMLAHDAEAVIEAKTPAEAAERHRENRENAFH